MFICLHQADCESSTVSGRIEAAEMAEAEAEAAEVEAVKAEGCIGGGGMYRRQWHALEEYGSGWSCQS
jgi:hypothetical protein